MSEVTVSQLASDVGIPIDRLLKQLNDAGLKKQSADDVISEQEKVELLNHLRRSHGKTEKEMGESNSKKVTLKRRTTSELRVSSTSTGRTAPRGTPTRTGKTVSVEVRRKRTVVKKNTESIPDSKKEALEELQAAKDALADQQAQKDASAAHEEARLKVIEEMRLQEEKDRENSDLKKEEKIDFGIKPDKKIKSSEKNVKNEVSEKQQGKEKEKVKRPKRMRAAPTESKDSEDERDRSRKGSGRRRELHVADEKRGKRSKSSKKTKEVSPDSQHGFQKPVEPKKLTIEVPETITVADLAQSMSVKAAEVIKVLMGMGMMVTINQVLDQETGMLLVEEMGHDAIIAKDDDAEVEILSAVDDELELGEKVPRAPVVTIMGHVGLKS